MIINSLKTRLVLFSAWLFFVRHRFFCCSVGTRLLLRHECFFVYAPVHCCAFSIFTKAESSRGLLWHIYFNKTHLIANYARIVRFREVCLSPRTAHKIWKRVTPFLALFLLHNLFFFCYSNFIYVFLLTNMWCIARI